MNYIFLPSLQHASIVRIASLIYYDREILDLIENEYIKFGWWRAVIGETQEKFHEAWNVIQTKIEEKLSSLLPTTLAKEIGKIIHPMSDQVKEWKLDHNFLVKSVGESYLDHIYWKTDGTINRIETAKKLVSNDNINLEIRFVLACTYFLEIEVVVLWERIAEVDQKKMTNEKTNAAVRFWMAWLQNQDNQPWTEMVDELMVCDMDGIRFPSIDPCDISLRVSAFFRFLSTENKMMYINQCYNGSVHHDDFRLCLQEMTEMERSEIFRLDGVHALQICLNWPFRILFVKMAAEIIKYLDIKDFAYLLIYMLNSYLSKENNDFHLLEEIWQISPADLKNGAKNNRYLISTANSVLKKEYVSQTFKDVVRYCFFIRKQMSVITIPKYSKKNSMLNQ